MCKKSCGDSCCFRGCCFHGDDDNGNGGICDCCLPGLQATLQFAFDNVLSVSIGTIFQLNSSEDKNLTEPITTLARFDTNNDGNIDVIYSICNIERILLLKQSFGNKEPQDIIDALQIYLNAISIPEECLDCCSEELRQLFEDNVGKSVTSIDSHHSNIVNNTIVAGYGPGVAIFEDKDKNVAIINLCYVSKVVFNN